jgi:hypothetical protein
MRLDDWELSAPAQLQFWPRHVHPTGAGAWHQPHGFDTLRDAVSAAITRRAPGAHVAWILTSTGRTLTPPEIEDLWIGMQAEAVGSPPSG